MITSLIILYFVIGCILTYIWYRKEVKDHKRYRLYGEYSDSVLNLLNSVILWPIVLLIYIEI